ncbi:hypothetical protein BLX24_27750 [Arsenicibacter rosenii]|uniref:Uncharacterized protein n=1 Tax=Arsenicibacter rosenii TaxID=1750698 RepID=A0A1S2VAX5_9BACT|nr:hypothetical protein BLX24_27750 [Arsenicibacter rosenii]
MRDLLGKGFRIDVQEREGRAASLVVDHRVLDGMTLYYVPLYPVWSFYEDGETAMYELMVSCYAYLYHVAGISWYTESGYLCYQYEAMKDYFGDELEYARQSGPEDAYDRPEHTEEDELESDEIMNLEMDLLATEMAINNGGAFHKILSEEKHLKSFGQRLEAFTPVTAEQQKLKEVVTEIYQLWQDFPERSAHDSIVDQQWLEMDEEEQENYEQELMTTDCWLSFIWDDDHVMEMIEENLNHDVQANSSGEQEPRSLIVFDRPDAVPSHDLSFDVKFYPLLNRLTRILYALNV